MPDNKTKVGKSDRTRININEDYELQDWADQLGVSKSELKKAIQEVGDKAADVKAFLKKSSK